MPSKHMKRCLTYLAIREMLINPPIGYCYKPIKMAKIKNIGSAKCWPEAEQLNHSYIAVGNVNWYSHSEKQKWL